MSAPYSTAPELSKSAVKPRIFFLGAHKILVKTELLRLRALGYEVFNPPYLSNVLDQSVQYVWDSSQETTLPPEIFKKLSRYSFFYNPISEEIAEILNGYFDAVIVTLVAGWATEAARAFSGPIIFRSYGQTALLSDNFERIGGREIIAQRENFYFCPFAEEVIEGEASWLSDKAVVVPYCLSSDVFENKGEWLRSETDRTKDIIVTAPNIAGNIFHTAHYQFINEYFPDPDLKLCGIQFVPVNDPRVIGVLERSDQLKLFSRASGYLYTYRDPRVCYLPPIEMAVLGGPVIYLKGSLLSRYVPDGPGQAATIDDARAMCARLKVGDASFAAELRDAQEPLIRRYDPDHVWPVFDREMQRLLPSEALRAEASPASVQRAKDDRLRQFVRQYLSDVQTTGAPSVSVEAQDAIRDMLELSAPVISRDMHGQKNYLTDGAIVLGKWEVDTASHVRVVVAEIGHAGWVIHGPYLDLPAGRYKVTFDLQVVLPKSGNVSPSKEVGIVDVVAKNISLGAISVSAERADANPLTVEFNLSDPVSDFEFRVSSTGACRLVVASIVLQGGH